MARADPTDALGEASSGEYYKIDHLSRCGAIGFRWKH